MKKTALKIEVVSDIVCPWCYIGKRRLEKAIRLAADKFEFKIEYKPFELNPSIPPEGYNNKSYLTKKFGSPEKYEQLTGHVANIAKQEGLNFNYDIQTKAPNTLKAHKLINFSKSVNKQPEVVEALFQAYFEKGVDLSIDENLLSIGASIGINPEDFSKVLNSQEKTLEVRNTERALQEAGVSSVPYYIINQRYGISGAQPAEVLVNIFEQASAENTQGESCDMEGNC